MNALRKLLISTFFSLLFTLVFSAFLQSSGQIKEACAATIGVGQQCPSGITNPYDHDVEAVNVNVKVNVTVGSMQPNSSVHIQAKFDDARTSECYVNCLLREESADVSWSGSIDHNFDNLGCSSGACNDTLTVNVSTNDSNCHIDNNSQSQLANANGASVSYNFNITCEAPLPTLPAETCNCQYEKDCVINGQPGKQQCGGSTSGGGACRASNACPTNDANNCTACLPTLSSPTPRPTITVTPLPTITTGPGTPTPTPIPTVPTSTPTPIGPTPTGPRPSVTLTPTPTRPANTPTPTITFDKNTCACDGMDKPNIFIGAPTIFTAYSKLTGTQANIGTQKFITFYMYKQDPAKPNETGTLIGGPADVNSVLVSNTTSPTRYRSQWTFTDTSKLEKNVTYMVYADTKKGCVQKTTAYNFETPTQVVLAAETQQVSFFDKIQGFITRLLSGFSSTPQQTTPTPAPTRQPTATPTPAQSGNLKLVPFYPANILEKSCQVLRFQLPS